MDSDPVLSNLDKMARSITLPFDEENNYHPEFDGYQLGSNQFTSVP